MASVAVAILCPAFNIAVEMDGYTGEDPES